jgi:hypothetical protein
MEFGSVVSLVSAGITLVASVVGPGITLTVARRQFNATVICDPAIRDGALPIPACSAPSGGCRSKP